MRGTRGPSGGTLAVHRTATGICFRVHVQARAARPGVAGLHGDAIKVRLSAPPLDGRANAELEALLAEALGIARRQVRVVAGAKARDKTVEATGVTAEHVRGLVTGPE